MKIREDEQKKKKKKKTLSEQIQNPNNLVKHPDLFHDILYIYAPCMTVRGLCIAFKELKHTSDVRSEMLNRLRPDCWPGFWQDVWLFFSDIECTVLLGRRNTVYSPTGKEMNSPRRKLKHISSRNTGHYKEKLDF